MYLQHQEDADYEFNAQFDYAREAYAATELDGYHEGYCDYLNDCEQEGEAPLDFDQWKETLRKPSAQPNQPSDWDKYGDDEIPF